MKNILILLITSIILFSCRKENKNTPPPTSLPEMRYTNLHDVLVGAGQPSVIEINGDEKNDFLFGTMLIGDPILRRDRLQFLAFSAISTYVLADPFNNSLVLNEGSLISANPPTGYDWFEVQDVLLAEKITPEAGPVFWQGKWKDVQHKYLPLQVRVDGNVYNGWVEISMDQAREKLILHKAAISKESGKNVKAGL